jgi:uncharacterized protein (TIGR04255 family)
MGQKMRNPPIFYTIGQIQFNPVLGMPKFIPEIQEALRKPFPDFRPEKKATLQMRIGDSAPAAQTTAQDRWHFIDIRSMSGYLLHSQALIFHTTAYETSEHFLEKVLDGIKLVNECAGLTYIDGVAIRTLDAILPEPNLNVRDYLDPSVRGISEGLDGELKHAITESFWEIRPHGLLISRVAILKGTLGLPMDLVPVPLEFKQELREINIEHAILDNDRQDKERFDFDEEQIRKKLLTVKKGATDAFEKQVSPLALERWN